MLSLIVLLLLNQAAVPAEQKPSRAEASKLEAEALSIWQGNPSKSERKRALELFEVAAGAGLPTSQYYYGAELLSHVANSEDRARGAVLLDGCARQGSASAQGLLGWYYLRTGDAVLQATGLKWVQAAAAQESVQALMALGNAYARGFRGIQRDPSKAIPLFRRATELGDLQQRGWAAWHLLHLTQDADISKRAVYVMEQAADEDGRACYVLAREYLLGSAIPKNYATAVHWFEKGRHLKVELNALWLSHMYAKGMGVKRDPVRAQQILSASLLTATVVERNDFAWGLATEVDDALRDGPLAVQVMESTLSNPSHRRAEYLDTLAAAYAEAGDFPRAITTQREAIAFAVGGDKQSELEILKQHLDSFGRGQPVREVR